eukprot:1981177-Prymnesium_polylepis.1
MTLRQPQSQPARRRPRWTQPARRAVHPSPRSPRRANAGRGCRRPPSPSAVRSRPLSRCAHHRPRS